MTKVQFQNADSTGKDCLKTCRRDLARNHRVWLRNVGLLPDNSLTSTVYISPLVSYEGEGLNSNAVPTESLRDIGEDEVVVIKHRLP